MIVSELIEQLKQLPQDSLVLARGYESGYNEVDKAEVITVVKMIDNESYDGDYNNSEFVRDVSCYKYEDKDIQSVILA